MRRRVTVRRRGRQGKLGFRFTQVVDPLARGRQFISDRLALLGHHAELRGDFLMVRHGLRLVAAGARELLVGGFARLEKLFASGDISAQARDDARARRDQMAGRAGQGEAR